MTAPPAGFFQKPLYKRRKMRYNGKAFAQRGIAQLVEQRSPKPRAEGSNPSAPAKALTERSELFCLSEGFEPPGGPCRRHAAGSRFVRRPRRSNAAGSPQRSAAGRAESFCPCQGSRRSRREFFCFRPPSCLPLTREVASPKGLTEGEIGRACCEAGCAERPPLASPV